MMNGHPTADFQQTAAEFNKLMMDSWGSWTKKTVNSDTFAAASSAYMDWSLATQRLMTDISGQFMESLDVPKRSDLARLSAQVQAVETRLLDAEESQEDLKALLASIDRKLDRLAEERAPGKSASVPAQKATEKATEQATEQVTEADGEPAKKSRSSSKRGKSK